MLAHSFLIESSSKLLVTRTGIKAVTSLISGWIRLLGVTCPWMMKIFHFRTWISLRPVGQSWSNFMCSITGGGERLHKVLRQIGSNSGVHCNRKPPLTYNRENGVSTFSRLLLIRSFLYLHVTRTCIKSRMSLNFGQVGPLTTELASCPWVSKKFPIDLLWENGVSMLACSFLLNHHQSCW